MAGKSPATDALREYRSKILSDDVETRVTVLAEKVAEYEAVAVDRQRTLGQIVSKSTWPDEAALEATVSQLREVAQRQWAAEDAVYVAFENAKKAGAKPSVLQQIGLRPEAALSAARGRAAPEPVEREPVAGEAGDAAATVAPGAPAEMPGERQSA